MTSPQQETAETDDDRGVIQPGVTPVIDTGTIARTTTLIAAFALMALSGVNQYLAAHGRSRLDIDQATVTTIITYLVSLAASLWAWWKPNNFTARARRKYALAETIQQDMLLQEAKKAYAASGRHVETGKEATSEPQEQASNIEAPASSADEARSAQDEDETGPGTGRAAATDARAALAAALKDLD